MQTKDELIAGVAAAKESLAVAELALAAFDELPENNVFASMDEAEGVVEDELRDIAHQDCEGAGNCGADVYTRTFIVDGQRYVGTLACEYNRHDKTYYYIEESEFTVKPEPQA